MALVSIKNYIFLKQCVKEGVVLSIIDRFYALNKASSMPFVSIKNDIF